MTPLARLKQTLAAPHREPLFVTGGLYLFTALYYTRILALQLLSVLVLLIVAVYWIQAIRRRGGMSWSDLKLTTDKLWLYVLLGVALAFFGWFWYSLYLYWTRGQSLRLGFGGSFPAILAILAVSVAEELFFRGYLQNRLAPRHSLWQRVLIAVVALSFYKVIVHMWEGLPLVLQVELFLLGVLHNVLPSLWMEWSDSLVGPLVMHVVWDLLVYAPLSAIPYWVI